MTALQLYKFIQDAKATKPYVWTLYFRYYTGVGYSPPYATNNANSAVRGIAEMCPFTKRQDFRRTLSHFNTHDTFKPLFEAYFQ